MVAKDYLSLNTIFFIYKLHNPYNKYYIQS